MQAVRFLGKAAAVKMSIVKTVGAAAAVIAFCVGCGGGGNGGTGGYKLNADAMPANGGTVEIEPVSKSYPALAKVEAAAKANDGFVFTGWSGEDTSASEKITITMSGKKHKNLTANFRKPPLFIDSRDGKRYGKVTIGSQTWMSENLNYHTPHSKCYGKREGNCAKYGRLYKWSDALEACPAGWHLPRNDEWDTLENYVGGKQTAGTKLKSSTGWGHNGNGTDEYGFSAMPGGYGRSGGIFYTAGGYGYWWSAADNGAGYAWGRYMYDKYEHMSTNSVNRTFLFSVRCVED